MVRRISFSNSLILLPLLTFLLLLRCSVNAVVVREGATKDVVENEIAVIIPSAATFLRGHRQRGVKNNSNSHTVPMEERRPQRHLMPLQNESSSSSSSNSNDQCGCSTCTEDVLTAIADGYSCGNRIEWVVENMDGYSKADACNLVGGEEFPSVCGGCYTAACPTTSTITVQVPPMCGCSTCTEDVLATNADGYACGNRIEWVINNMDGYSETDACNLVAGEEFSSVCGGCHTAACSTTTITVPPTTELTMGPTSTPTQKPTMVPTNAPTVSPTKQPIPDTMIDNMCGCSTCTDEILTANAGGNSCGSRIDWVINNMDGFSEADACSLVAEEYPNICGLCHASHCGSSFPPSPVLTGGGGGGGGTVKVMSYNTEYTGYSDGRVSSFGAKIAEVQADVVGVQECQDANALAIQSGYTVLPVTGQQNYILYNSNRVQYIDSGTMDIPRDNYAPRTVTFGKFRITTGSGAGNEFWFFNTHLPHRHNQAADPNTHAKIGRMVVAKRTELGADHTPTIVVGDCNPFASAGASEGSFESNLANGGIVKKYEATGSTGGYGGLDKIFASQDDWIGDGADVGTGRSDHPAIAADLTFIK